MNLPPPPMWTASQPPFTAAQWQELEHQALIFKYLKAGLTVPPDLLISIHNSLLRRHPSLGYYSYFGKKIDPEPGRCRRTDGKKWRCSRDACLDSKYCERHMLRRRYRSRKPVESSASQSAPAPKSSIEVVAAAASGSRGGSGSGSGSGTFRSLPLHATGACEGFSLGNNDSFGKLQMESFPSEVSKKEFRFGLNFEADEHNFISKDLGNARHQGVFSSDAMWSHMSQISSNSVSESRNGSIAISNCFQKQTGEDAKPLDIAAARSEQHVTSGQLSLSSAGCLKQEYQSPPSLFSDWHWKKDFGSSGL